ncbi:MAG: rhamnose transport system ATP-binding protein [Pseudonocardiales bacterium]|jgi:ABC-type sugar transport system ATPase subunit|nr:rhamnose transport system ATP-binding protein [Pseudonocardiales bacterium]
MEATVGSPVLAVEGVEKRFGGVAALSGASFSLAPSSTLALVGENGAGKSTLLKILSGALQADAGTVTLQGEEARFGSPIDASRHGVATVYQELSLFPDLTVAENLVIGDYPRRRGLISWASARRATEELLDRLGMPVPADRLVGELGLAEGYLVEIAKALRHRPRILILDEPTAALDPHDAERIFTLMDSLRADGTSMIFVSHRLEELMRTSQQYMVLKDGRTTAEGLMRDTSEDDLVAKMLGDQAGPTATSGQRAPLLAVSERPQAASTARTDVALEVVGLRTDVVSDVSFRAHRGEIIGLAGLRGSGQSELCRALVGADRATAGRMAVLGREYAPRTPHDAWERGLGFVPAERKSEGLFLNMTVAQNVLMSRLLKDGTRWISRRGQNTLAARFRASLDMRLPGGDLATPVTALSGGNQQKVVLARCLAADLSVLVLDEPTRGVDVGAKHQIHDVIRELAEEGLSVIVSSSELSELLLLCSRVIVMHRGAMAGELQGAELEEHTIIRLASGAAA